MVFFNAAGAPEQVSLELYMVLACLGLPTAWLDFDCAVSEVVATIALFIFLRTSPFLLSSLVSSDLPGSESLESMRLANIILMPRSPFCGGAGLTPMSAHQVPSVFVPSARSLLLFAIEPPIGSSAICHFGIFGPIIRGRQDGPGTPSTLRRRLPGPWPAALTHGGVELNCELNVSQGFSFC